MKMQRLNPQHKKNHKIVTKILHLPFQITPWVFPIILIYCSSFHAIIKQNMSVGDKLPKQKGFPSRSQTQRKIKIKSKLIAGINSKEKINGFLEYHYQKLPKSTRQLIRGKNQSHQENKCQTRKKSKLAFLQFYDQKLSKIGKLDNIVTKKLSQYSQNILKVKKSFCKPKNERIDQIKKKSFSAIETKKQIKQKLRIQIEKQKISIKEDASASRPLESLCFPSGNSQNMKIPGKDLNVGQFQLIKQNIGCFQFLRRLRRKERQGKPKKNVLNECKFVIKPFQNIKLKRCTSQRSKRTDNQQIGINTQQLNGLEITLELHDISQIREVSFNPQSPLGNQSFQILQLLKLEKG